MTFVLYLQQVSVHSRHPSCEHLPLLTSSSSLWLQPCSATGLLQTINTTEGQRQRASSKHSAIFASCYYLITLVSSANVSPVLHLMSTVIYTASSTSAATPSTATVSGKPQAASASRGSHLVKWDEGNDIAWCVSVLHSSWKWVARTQQVMLQVMSSQGGKSPDSAAPFSTAAAPPCSPASFVLSSFLSILLTGPFLKKKYLSDPVLSPCPHASFTSF